MKKMQGVSVVCFLLCIGAVCSRGVPVQTSPPIPAPYPETCNWKFGPYIWTSVSLSPQTIGNTQYFYRECFYYRPQSQCTGGCSSNQTLYTNSVNKCQCCQATSYQTVDVTQVYCRYIFMYSGCKWRTLRGELVSAPSLQTRNIHPEVEELKYYILGGCTCSSCPTFATTAAFATRQGDSDLPDELRGLGERKIDGLTAPPSLSEVPRAAAYDEMADDEQVKVYQSELTQLTGTC